MNGVPSTLHRSRGRIIALGVVLSIVVLDQLVKHAIVARFALDERLAVVPGFFDITYLLNRGGVWGLGRDMSSGPRTAVFLALPIVITLLAAWYSWKLPAGERLRQAAIALVVGGALGNLIDRLRMSPPAVVDFLLFQIKGHYWPAFNLADSSICVGVAVLLICTFLEEEDDDRAHA